ncbi:MAG: hypothetical protein AAGD06_03955 [Acidobacteriota bacterium]
MTDKSTWAQHVFHVDLSQSHEGEEYWMHAAGRGYPLAPHTEESRARLRSAAPHLADVPDHKLTHFTAKPILLPRSQVVRVHVKHTLSMLGESGGPDKKGGTGSYHSAVVQPPAGGDPAPAHHHHIDWTSTAKSLVFHHPDLITHDPDVAKVVFEYMNNDQTSKEIVQKINDLATAMSKMGPPTPVGAKNPGWATLTPMQVPNKTGGGDTTYYQQVPSEGIVDAAGDVMTAMMVATKNDNALKGKKWSQPLGETVSTEPHMGLDAMVELVKDPPPTDGGVQGDDWTARLTKTGVQHGLKTELTVTDTTKRTVKVTMNNSYIRWLGVYIAFYDAENNILDISGWDFDSGIPGIGVLENKHYRCLGYIQPVNAFMAIPIPIDPGQLNDGDGVTFSFPELATSAKIFGVGLGTGSIPYGTAVVLGGVATGLSNFAIPAFMLGFAVASNSYKPLYDIMQNKKVIGVLIGVGGSYFAYEFTNEAVAHKKMNFRALSSLSSILFNVGLTKVLLWVEAQLVEGEIEDEIPFSGWITTALNIATGVAQMAETIIEVATSPWFIKNDVKLSITSQVAVHPDPRHQAWPQGQAGASRTCVAKMIYKDQARPTVSQTFEVPADFTRTSIGFSFENNTLGGQVKIEADFYVDDWLAGQANSGWIDNEEDIVQSTTLYLVEKPKPITGSTTFAHSSILTYKDNNYQWVETADGPTATIADLKTSSNGNEISECVGLTLSQRHAVIGAAWKAAGTGLVPRSGGGTDTQVYAVQSQDIPGRPMTDLKWVTRGTMQQSMLMYDPYPPKFEMKDGTWVLDPTTHRPVPDPKDIDLGTYYIDPSKAQESLGQGGGYHLRKVDPSGASPFDPTSYTLSHGRFPYFPDHVTMHPSGHVIGVSQKYGKVMVLALDPAGAADKDIPVASDKAGKALIHDREGLLFAPVAVSCSYDGTILILDQIVSMDQKVSRIQAFDLLGRPVQCFEGSGGSTTALLPLPSDVHYLDLAVVGNQHLTYLFVLYFTGAGDATADYKVAVYKYGDKSKTSDLEAVVVASNVPAARICVDMWHSFYTLNYQMVHNTNGLPQGPKDPNTGPAGRTVVSVSEYVPSVP